MSLGIVQQQFRKQKKEKRQVFKMFEKDHISTMSTIFEGFLVNVI